MHMTTNHPFVVKLNENYPFTVLYNFVYDFIRKLIMLCSANFVTKKKIDECLLSCLSNISFNIITYSVIHLCTTQKRNCPY